VLTLYTTPVIYLFFDRLGKRLGVIVSHGAVETLPAHGEATPAMA
jgi:hypothetical protein